MSNFDSKHACMGKLSNEGRQYIFYILDVFDNNMLL